MEPPAGGAAAEQLCVLLLGAEVEQEQVRRKEVACQWEAPPPSPPPPPSSSWRLRSREVGCQSDSAELRDVAVQVDLLPQQLEWTGSAPPAVLLQCLSVRADGPNGGALLQHCTPATRTRTRTRTIKPAARLSPELSETRSQRRAPPAARNATEPQSKRRRGRPRLQQPPQPQPSPPEADPQEEEEPQAEGEGSHEEEEGPQEEEEQSGDPNWTPVHDVEAVPSYADGASGDSDSQHAPVKLEGESIMCDVCGKVMKNKSSLARHSFIHTGKKPFACHLCELRFNRRDNLRHHLDKLHPNGAARVEKQRAAPAWLCAACGKTFSCRSRLKAHEIIHSGVKPYRCDLCPKAYMRTNDLEHHKKMVHVEGDGGGGGGEAARPSSLLCDFCGKEFKCRSQLLLHMQTHTGERPHLCDICGRKFARPHQLKRHKILLHANQPGGHENPPPPSDLPFPCDVCGKRLKSEAHLAAHSHVHSDDKPHRCGVCLRSFQSATCLKQHHMRVRVSGVPHGCGRRRKSVSLTSAAKAFPCPVCGKVFKFQSLLTSHALVHSESRPHACDFCSRSFRRRSHLKRHREVVHANGARPLQSFVCHICGKDKKCRSQLERHVIIHTGERPFACDLCPARFNRQGNLQQHRRRMHDVGRAEPEEEAPPILLEDDAMLSFKQEETVVAIDTTVDASAVDEQTLAAS